MAPGLRLALAALDRIAAAPDGVGFTALRRALDLPTAASLARQLKALAEAGWVEGGGGRPWRAGPAFVGAGRALGRRPDPGRHAQPIVEALADATGESAAAVAWVGDGFRFLAKSERPDSYHYFPVGATNRDPLVHAFGQCCLAWQPPEERAAWTERAGAGFPRRCAAIRAQGWHHGRDKGLRICAPVLARDGRLRCVLGISLLPLPLRRARLEALAATVRRCAADLARRLESA